MNFDENVRKAKHAEYFDGEKCDENKNLFVCDLCCVFAEHCISLDQQVLINLIRKNKEGRQCPQKKQEQLI